MGNISLEEKQNMWTVERGYSSEEFKRDEEMYPRPGVGNQELKIIKIGKKCCDGSHPIIIKLNIMRFDSITIDS